MLKMVRNRIQCTVSSLPSRNAALVIIDFVSLVQFNFVQFCLSVFLCSKYFVQDCSCFLCYCENLSFFSSIILTAIFRLEFLNISTIAKRCTGFSELLIFKVSNRIYYIHKYGQFKMTSSSEKGLMFHFSQKDFRNYLKYHSESCSYKYCNMQYQNALLND